MHTNSISLSVPSSIQSRIIFHLPYQSRQSFLSAYLFRLSKINVFSFSLKTLLPLLLLLLQQLRATTIHELGKKWILNNDKTFLQLKFEWTLKLVPATATPEKTKRRKEGSHWEDVDNNVIVDISTTLLRLPKPFQQLSDDTRDSIWQRRFMQTSFRWRLKRHLLVASNDIFSTFYDANVDVDDRF